MAYASVEDTITPVHVKGKTLKDEKNPHLNENICFISSPSSSLLPNSTTSNYITLITTTAGSAPEIVIEDEVVLTRETKLENIENLFENNNIQNLKMVYSNNDTNNDCLYSQKLNYDHHKIIEHQLPNLSVLSPESTLCDFEESERIIYDNNNDLSYSSSEIVEKLYKELTGMDTPISHGSPALPDEDENITSKDCIAPNLLHIHSQSNDYSTMPSCSNTDNNALNDDDDIDPDMEKLQNIDTNVTKRISIKRKMETMKNSPIKKKRFNLKKIDTTLKAPPPTNDGNEIMTPQVLDTVLELEEIHFNKTNTSNIKMRVQSPAYDESSNMSTKKNLLQNFPSTSTSPFMDVGTDNLSFFHENNNNIHQKNFNHYDESSNQLLNKSLTYISTDDISIKNEVSTSVASLSGDISIKYEDPPSVDSLSSSSERILWSTDILINENPPSVISSSSNHIICSSTDDYTYSTAPATPSTPFSTTSCQRKRGRGRPRIVHRLEPTQKELENLSEQDKKQKLLRAKNNKASQVSRDKKRSKVQQKEYENMIQEKKNKLLKKQLSKYERIESIYKNVLQKHLESKV